jgi:hypothetical protein
VYQRLQSSVPANDLIGAALVGSPCLLHGKAQNRIDPPEAFKFAYQSFANTIGLE